MSIVVAGLSYRSARLDLLERLTFSAATLATALSTALRELRDVEEAVILSTCNRVEVYAVASDPSFVAAFLSDVHHVPVDDFLPAMFTHQDDDAARHLFAVASGIDSMVLGETQILGQVRDAFAAARAAGTTGPVLAELFARAEHTGRRARAETGITSGKSALAVAGATLASRDLGSLDGKTILFAGTGTVGDEAARVITSSAPGASTLVWGRTPERARALAARIGGTAVATDDLGGALARADFVVASTGAPGQIVTATMVTEAMRARGERSLVLVDCAVPRDIDPACASIPGVRMYDLDALRGALSPSPSQTRDIQRVHAIIAEEADAFAAWRGANLASSLRAIEV